MNARGGRGEGEVEHVVIRGRERLAGGVAGSGQIDHRIAMREGIGAIRCQGPVTITGAECVKKSYPDFWEDYRSLGGRYTCDT